MTAPSFNYGLQPPRAVSGMIADAHLCTVDSVTLRDSTGAQSGRALLGIPNGFPSNGVQVAQRVRTAGTRAILGFVVYNPGKPGDVATQEYQTAEVVPVCRAGRQWVYCENFALDPALAPDAWYVRNTGATAGNLRHGDDDGATCTRIPVGQVRALQATALTGGAALVLLDFDFRRPLVIPSLPVWGGEYAPGTTYAAGVQVHETGGSAPGAYVNISGASQTGVLPSTHPLVWQLVALD